MRLTPLRVPPSDQAGHPGAARDTARSGALRGWLPGRGHSSNHHIPHGGEKEGPEEDPAWEGGPEVLGHSPLCTVCGANCNPNCLTWD